MVPASQSLHDPARLAALKGLNLLDSPAEAGFDRLTRLAATVIGAPLCLVSLVDQQRQFFKSTYGLRGPVAITRQTPLTHSFCQHVVTSGAPFLVSDASQHPLVCDNLAIPDLGMVAYLGVPIRSAKGFVLGSFCVIDTKPRQWLPREVDLLLEFVGLVETEINLRAALKEKGVVMRRQRAVLDSTTLAVIATSPEGIIDVFNVGAERMLGYTAEEMIGQSPTMLHLADEMASRAAELTEQLGRKIEPGFESFVSLVRLGQTDEREWTYVRKNGGHVSVQLTITAIKDDADTVTGFLAVAQDLTERNTTKQALQASENRLSSVLTDAHCMVWEATVTWINQAWAWDINAYPSGLYRILSEGAECPPGAYIWHGHQPLDRPEMDRCSDEALAAGAPGYVQEFRLLREGRVTWLHESVSIKPAGSGRFSLVGVAVDITEHKEAQAAHNESVARLNKLATLVPGMIYQFRLRRDGTSCFPYASEAVRQIFGVTPEAVREDGNPIFATLHSDDLAMVSASIQVSARTLQPWLCDFRVRRSDGGERWVRGNSVPEAEVDGSILWHGIIIDVTERKEEERVIQVSEERMRLAGEAAGVAVWEWDVFTGTVLWSPGMFEIYGLSPTATHEISYQVWADAVHPVDLAVQQAKLTELVTSGGRCKREFRIINQKTREIRFVQAAETVVKDSRGAAARVVGVNLDITERRMAEDATRRALTELEHQKFALDQHALVAVTDIRGRIIHANEQFCAISQYRREELIGRTHRMINSGHHSKEFFEEMYRTISSGAVWHAEICNRAKDGSLYWVYTTIVPFKGSEEKPTHYIAIRSDITERKGLELSLAQARDQALESSRLKSEFLANMSHEIRTPMNGIIGMAGLLMESPLNEKQREMGRVINASAEGLLEIVNDVLDFSKIEAGKLRIEPEEFELRPVFEDTLAMLAFRAHEKGIELLFDFDERLDVPLLGDAGRIRQMLTNLTGNAIKFTAKGEVVVRAQLVEDGTTQVRWRLSVHDTGIGIPPEVQARLFQPFSQADGTTTRNYGGTGLGLAITRQLVELMGGRIGLSSETGKGSEFWFELDLPHGAGSPVARPPSLPGGTRILIVDDNLTNRKILISQISSMGGRVDAVDTGLAALAQLRQAAEEGEAYSAAVVDWHMPGMDGLQLAEKIRADSNLAATQLILLSSAGPKLQPDELARNYFAVCLNKPVRVIQLHRALCRVLGLEPTGKKTLSRPPMPVWQGGLNLLVADDNTTNQLVILRLLEKLGCSMDFANNGAEAVKMATQKSYDAILMDCQMPVMDGYSATQQIRVGESADPTRRRIPIFALTAYALPSDRQKCLDAGMDDYLSKPLRVEELKRVLSQCKSSNPLPLSKIGVEAIAAPRTESTERALDPEQIELLSELPGRKYETLLQDVIEMFLGDAPVALAAMAAAGKLREQGKIMTTAHRLAGACANLGAGEMRTNALAVERTAETEDWVELEKQIQALDQEWQAVRPALEKLRAPQLSR